MRIPKYSEILKDPMKLIAFIGNGGWIKTLSWYSSSGYYYPNEVYLYDGTYFSKEVKIDEKLFFMLDSSNMLTEDCSNVGGETFWRRNPDFFSQMEKDLLPNLQGLQGLPYKSVIVGYSPIAKTISNMQAVIDTLDVETIIREEKISERGRKLKRLINI